MAKYDDNPERGSAEAAPEKIGEYSSGDDSAGPIALGAGERAVLRQLEAEVTDAGVERPPLEVHLTNFLAQSKQLTRMMRNCIEYAGDDDAYNRADMEEELYASRLSLLGVMEAMVTGEDKASLGDLLDTTRYLLLEQFDDRRDHLSGLMRKRDKIKKTKEGKFSDKLDDLLNDEPEAARFAVAKYYRNKVMKEIDAVVEAAEYVELLRDVSEIKRRQELMWGRQIDQLDAAEENTRLLVAIQKSLDKSSTRRRRPMFRKR